MASERNGRRRVNGEGTIRLHKSGLYEARVTLADGRRVSLYDKSEQGVRRKLDKAKYDRDRGGLVLTGGSQTLATFLSSWLEIKKATRAYRTWKSYADLTNKHLIPSLGHVTLLKLTPQQIQRFYAAKLEDLSPTTCRHIHAVLHAALKYALL